MLSRQQDSAAFGGTPSAHRSAIQGTNSGYEGTLNENPRFRTPEGENGARGAIFAVSGHFTTHLLSRARQRWAGRAEEKWAGGVVPDGPDGPGRGLSH